MAAADILPITNLNTVRQHCYSVHGAAITVAVSQSLSETCSARPYQPLDLT